MFRKDTGSPWPQNPTWPARLRSPGCSALIAYPPTAKSEVHVQNGRPIEDDLDVSPRHADRLAVPADGGPVEPTPGRGATP